jgi:mono/diheme cytochrome c family protein
MYRIAQAALLVLVLPLMTSACSETESMAEGPPHVAGASSPEEAGRYLLTIGGCHDCHTPGFLETGWEVPESDWFTGTAFGWRGPWGTTYGANLRLTVQNLTEDQFVETLRSRKALPPMPWPLVSQMSEPDMRAIYKYLRSLGPAGVATPAPLPPGEEPQTPYVILAPPTFPQ